jgi:hypothetical protein
MTEEQRQQIRDLAKEAREAADAIRPIEDIPGAVWVAVDGIANDLAALDWDLAREGLGGGQA